VTMITARLNILPDQGLPGPAASPPDPPKPGARLPPAPPPQVRRPSGGALQAEPSAKPASPQRARTRGPGAFSPPQTKSTPPPPPLTRRSSEFDSFDAYDMDSDGPGPRDTAAATSRPPPPKPARVPDPRRKLAVRRGEESSSDDGVPVGPQARPAHRDKSSGSMPTLGRQNPSDQRALPARRTAKGAKAVAPAKASQNSSESSDSEAENPRGGPRKRSKLVLSMQNSNGSDTGAEPAGSTRVGSWGKPAAPAPSKLVQGRTKLDSDSDSSS
jgi:hypothetical protein